MPTHGASRFPEPTPSHGPVFFVEEKDDTVSAYVIPAAILLIGATLFAIGVLDHKISPIMGTVSGLAALTVAFVASAILIGKSENYRVLKALALLAALAAIALLAVKFGNLRELATHTYTLIDWTACGVATAVASGAIVYAASIFNKRNFNSF